MKKISRTKIELFIECPLCFWLDVKKGIRRPPPAPYTINSAIDYLLKQEFDFYREKQKPHPVMVANKIEVLPYKSPELSGWRNNFKGVSYHHEPTDFLVFGAIDDVWVNPKGELIVVDYKATGANEHKVHDFYKRQLDVYSWLFSKNDYKVSPVSYFLFAKADKSKGFKDGKLSFNLILESYKTDTNWIEGALLDARKILDSDTPPPAQKDCIFCAYRSAK